MPIHDSTSHLNRDAAPPALRVEVAAPFNVVILSFPGRASSLILASNPVLDALDVIVVFAFVTIAVIAVPLELMMIIVDPLALVLIATAVASEPVPTVVDRPGVKVRVALPSVIGAPTAREDCEPCCVLSFAGAVPRLPLGTILPFGAGLPSVGTAG